MSRLREAFEKKEFVITCEFVPGRGKDGHEMKLAVDFAREVKAGGPKIHAISLTDSPGGNPAISPEGVGSDIKAEGVEPLVHFATGDMNRNALEARAMALARHGLNSVLAVSGDYPVSGYKGRAAEVFDLDVVQTIKYMKEMNSGLEFPGRKKGTTDKLPPTDFFVGAAVSPFKLREDEYLPQLFKMERKIKAGADFIITQLGYDMRKYWELKQYMLARGLTTPVVGNVYVLSFGAAKVMRKGLVPGCVVTDELVAELEEESKADDKGKAKRLERAARMTAVLKGMGFEGVHIGGFALKTEDFKFIIEKARELEPEWESFVPELCFGRPDEFYLYPAPSSFKQGESAQDPVPSMKKGGTSPLYGFILLMHRMLFEERSLGYKFMRGYYRLIDKLKFISKCSHLLELGAKKVMFSCQDCGDCGLPDVAYKCPQSQCAKQQRNGPCGGSRDGMCEVYPDEKPCVWTIAYRRLKSVGRLDEMRSLYVAPRNNDLEHSSGWSNYFLERDHNAEES